MLYLAIIIFIIVNVLGAIVLEKNKHIENIENIDYKEKYRKKEYLLTKTELKFYKILKQITDNLNLKVCPQVNLYEIVQNKSYKDFNKIQSKTIDFVITEPNLKIKLCIELDDYTHTKDRRIKRDEFINKLFKDLNIKLLRIPVQNSYNIEEIKKKIEEVL